MFPHTVKKPKYRGPYYKQAAKNYFIFKRYFNWLFSGDTYARVQKETTFDHLLIRHRSFLLRPLKDVDMYLQHNKVTNLRLAIGHLHQVVIKPGETFSFWRLVGKPIARKGYLEGLVLENGKAGKGIGGGLCQLGNLLYWMTLHTPFTIKERWRHGYDVFPDINRTIPFACGATLSYNYVDLQLENRTEYTFQINLWLDKEYLNGEITSDQKVNQQVEIVEKDHSFQHQWWGGYTRHNKIYKRITNLVDQTVHEELVTDNSAVMMYNPLLKQ